MKKILRILSVVLVAVVCMTCLFACKDDKQENNKVYMAEDTYYKVTNVAIANGINESLPLNTIIDENEGVSYMKLSADGQMHLEIRLNKFTYSAAKISLALVDASTIDILGFECYVEELIPGCSLRDLETALNKLSSTIGLSVCGIDYSSAEIKAITDGLANEGHLPQKLVLPDEVYFTLDHPYELKEIPTITQEENFKAVYVGEYAEGSEPYLIMTQYKNEAGVDCIRIVNELLFLTIELEKYTPAPVTE